MKPSIIQAPVGALARSSAADTRSLPIALACVPIHPHPGQVLSLLLSCEPWPLLLPSADLFCWPLFQLCHWALPWQCLWSHVLYSSGLVLITAGPSLSPRPLQPETAGQDGGREDSGLSWPMPPTAGALAPSSLDHCGWSASL